MDMQTYLTERQLILDEIEKHKLKIQNLKYDLELLRRKKPKFDWNLIKCLFGFHIWTEPEDMGSKRTCRRCGLVQRREHLAPDGFWDEWKIWRD